MDETVTMLSGIFSSQAYDSPALAFEEDVEPAPSTVPGIAPLSEGFQATALGPAAVAAPAGTPLGSAIASFPVQQVFPSFQTTVMPGNVFAGPMVPIGGRRDTLGGIAGSGIGPLARDETEDFLPPPRPPLPFPLDDGKMIVTAATVGTPLENPTGTAEFASRRDEGRFVAPDDTFLGFPRGRPGPLRGIEVAPHAGYFYFGGMDWGPNAGIGSDGVPRLHDGFDQYRTLPPPVEPDCMCATAQQTGELLQPPPSPLRLFEGEERALSLGRGAGFAPDSISDVVGGVPPLFEAEAPLSPLQHEVNAGVTDLPASPLSKGGKLALEGLLDLGKGLPGAQIAAYAAGGVGAGGALIAGSFGGARVGSSGPAGAAALQTAAAAGARLSGGGGGGLVGQSAAARVDREDAQRADSKAQQKLDAAQAKSMHTSNDLRAAQARDMEAKSGTRQSADYANVRAENMKARAELEKAKGSGDAQRLQEAREKATASEAKLKELEKEPTEAQKEGIRKAQMGLDAANEEATKAEADLEKAKKAAVEANARYEQAKAEVERLDDLAARTVPDYGNHLDRVGDAVERYRQYKRNAELREEAHDAKMGAGSGNALAAADARMLGQKARNGRDEATGASARLTQLRGHISQETSKEVKDKIKALKEAAKATKDAAKKLKDAARYGPPSRTKDKDKDGNETKEARAKREADETLARARDDLAEALKKAEDEAAANKGDKDKKNGKKEDEKPHEYSGNWPDCDPAGCKCPGDCGTGDKGKKCLWCIWIPWPPPGEKGKGVGTPPSSLGLMPPDTGIMGLSGFPFHAMMQLPSPQQAPQAPALPEAPPPRGQTPRPGESDDREQKPQMANIGPRNRGCDDIELAFFFDGLGRDARTEKDGGKGEYTAIGASFEKFQKDHPQAGAFYYTQASRRWSPNDDGAQAALDTVRRYEMWAKDGVIHKGRCCCPRVKVYLFGYSRGGVRAAQVGALLNAEGIPVFFLGLIDPVGTDPLDFTLIWLLKKALFGETRPGSAVPGNVEHYWEGVASEDPTDILETVFMPVTVYQPGDSTVDWTKRGANGKPVPYNADHDRIGWGAQPDKDGKSEDVKGDLDVAVAEAELIDERAAMAGKTAAEYLRGIKIKKQYENLEREVKRGGP